MPASSTAASASPTSSPLPTCACRAASASSADARSDYTLLPFQPAHAAAVSRFYADVFGPGCFARAAFRLREGAAVCPQASWLAFGNERSQAHDSASSITPAPPEICGAVLMVPVTCAGTRAYWLGPIAVAADWRTSGVGTALMLAALDAADAAGVGHVGLVGDPPFYARFGFTPAALTLPGPADPQRILMRSAAGAGVLTGAVTAGWCGSI